jgi:hypothetical protein
MHYLFENPKKQIPVQSLDANRKIISSFTKILQPFYESSAITIELRLVKL